MKTFVTLNFLLFILAGLMSCGGEVPKEAETVKIEKVQPEDTLDLLAENFVVNAASDTTNSENQELPDESTSGAKTENELPAPAKVKSEKKKPRKKPKISFETESYSFGRMMQGEEKEFKFKFKNTGNADLQIVNVTATCGCTTPSYPFIPISPGEEGYIGVSYNSTGKLGAQKPAITVVTNASPKTYKLYLEGTVDTKRED